MKTTTLLLLILLGALCIQTYSARVNSRRLFRSSKAEATQCTKTVTDAAKCGSETITDATKCGSTTVTDGTKCGYHIKQSPVLVSVDGSSYARLRRLARLPIHATYQKHALLLAKCTLNFPCKT